MAGNPRSAEAVVAIDLGASNGRCLLVRYDGKRLSAEELHRFDNRPIRFNDRLRWNVVALWEEILTGLAAAAQQRSLVRSVGVDSWGVDFALLGPNDTLLDLPIAYRDQGTAGCMEQVVSLVTRERIYSETGIQFLPFNTLYQLYARARDAGQSLHMARHLLMIPDLFAFLLTGSKAGEYTNATTTQMVGAESRHWSELLTRFLGLRPEILPKLMPPGTVVSSLRQDVVTATGLRGAVLTATATHDTASAIAGIPAEQDSWAYISCGTWSLIGQELPYANVSSAALAQNFTNEGGVGATYRFLKNIQGMWILQQCQREWAARGQRLTSSGLVRAAMKAKAFGFLIDPDDATLLNPLSMLGAIKALCGRTRQQFDPDPGAVTRAILESLALKHRRTLAVLCRLTGVPAEVIHLAGGGSRNRLLCQWTADAAGLPVLAGPAEATAIGNAVVQGIALGWFQDLHAARRAIRHSLQLEEFAPGNTEPWHEADERFERVIQRALTRATHA